MGRKDRRKRPIVYRNRNYGFAIVFPRWWKPYTVVNRKAYSGPNETVLSFLYRYRGKVYEPIFSVHISELKGSAWKKVFGDSPVTFLGQHGEFTYGYSLPGELPSAFLTSDQQEYDYVSYGRPIRILKKLVAGAPKVLHSIYFIDKPQRIHGCGCPGLRRGKRTERTAKRSS